MEAKAAASWSKGSAQMALVSTASACRRKAGLAWSFHCAHSAGLISG
ncbi:hypothetical protein [Streptomyces bobili]